MSVDTRTPRTPDPSGRRPENTPRGSSSGFFDAEPVLSTVKVPSDPAQVIVTHASFRVQLAPPVTRPTTIARSLQGSPLDHTDQLPALSGMTARPPRRAPVVWGARAEAGDSGDQGLTELMQTVRADAGRHGTEPAGSATQVLPRIEEGTLLPGPASGSGPGGSATVVAPRGPRPSETTQQQPLLHGMWPAEGAFDGPQPGDYDYQEQPDEDEEFDSAGPFGAGRQAYYPGRRMNLGVVLLPLRIFLGFISIYAGVGKLCDPVYFDGGDRGSLVTWLRSLEPWTIASPLRDFALAHPVGSGLTVAFLQLIVGVLTMCGLWQRFAAAIGALLSAALLMTVSWSTVPAYEAPDIIYLAAWSPLIIAGAPVYSVDGRLATDAWRKLGPRAGIRDLRRRVLRRGTVIATVVVGLALLTGSTLGGAVRSSQTATVPEPGEPPTNQLPGSPDPKRPGDRTGNGQTRQGQSTQGTAGGPDSRSSDPSAPASQDGQDQNGDPSAPSGPETEQAPQRTTPGAPPPGQTTPGTQATSGGGASTAGGSGSGGSGGGSASGGSSGGGSSSGGNGGGLGGLLG
ncbi:MAG: DoxX family membrane protein [Streptomyces sp.]|uniref:DoxX family protein n=1 Tax=Streptomyces sp. TaxID=1931 RepID=UPI003D6A8F5E